MPPTMPMLLPTMLMAVLHRLGETLTNAWRTGAAHDGAVNNVHRGDVTRPPTD